MFNDYVQGTSTPITGGIISAVKESGVAPKDHRAVFRRRSAGVGVAQQIVEYSKYLREGFFWVFRHQRPYHHD
jgi:malate dehydrogenase (oxaloacetate-decarboxylating)(NADP+)